MSLVSDHVIDSAEKSKKICILFDQLSQEKAAHWAAFFGCPSFSLDSLATSNK
jgi:hypothetical protein